MLVSVRTAASILGLTPQTVRVYILRGRLQAVRLPGGAFRIPEEEVAAVQRSVNRAPRIERSTQSSTQN